jgi:hypothetical protein
MEPTRLRRKHTTQGGRALHIHQNPPYIERAVPVRGMLHGQCPIDNCAVLNRRNVDIPCDRCGNCVSLSSEVTQSQVSAPTSDSGLRLSALISVLHLATLHDPVPVRICTLPCPCTWRMHMHAARPGSIRDKSQYSKTADWVW